MPFLKKRKEKRKYVARPGVEPRTPDLRVRCPTDCATRPGVNTQAQIHQAINVAIVAYLFGCRRGFLSSTVPKNVSQSSVFHCYIRISHSKQYQNLDQVYKSCVNGLLRKKKTKTKSSGQSTKIVSPNSKAFQR